MSSRRAQEAQTDRCSLSKFIQVVLYTRQWEGSSKPDTGRAKLSPPIRRQCVPTCDAAAPSCAWDAEQLLPRTRPHRSGGSGPT